MLHPDLLATQVLTYVPCGFCVNRLQPEPASADYAASTLLLNGLRGQRRYWRCGADCEDISAKK